MSLPKASVYILRSLADRGRYYTGVTANLVARLGAHNAGLSAHTAKWKPWAIDVLFRLRRRLRPEAPSMM